MTRKLSRLQAKDHAVMHHKGDVKRNMYFNPCEGKDLPALLLESLAKLKSLLKQLN